MSFNSRGWVLFVLGVGSQGHIQRGTVVGGRCPKDGLAGSWACAGSISHEPLLVPMGRAGGMVTQGMGSCPPPEALSYPTTWAEACTWA